MDLRKKESGIGHFMMMASFDYNYLKFKFCNPGGEQRTFYNNCPNSRALIGS